MEVYVEADPSYLSSQLNLVPADGTFQDVQKALSSVIALLTENKLERSHCETVAAAGLVSQNLADPVARLSARDAVRGLQEVNNLSKPPAGGAPRAERVVKPACLWQPRSDGLTNCDVAGRQVVYARQNCPAAAILEGNTSNCGRRPAGKHCDR